MPARADTLHDLLPDIAALVKVERVALQGLLRESGVEDILAVARAGVLQAHHASRFSIREGELRHPAGRQEDAKSGLAGEADTRDDSPAPLQVRVRRFGNRR